MTVDLYSTLLRQACNYVISKRFYVYYCINLNFFILKSNNFVVCASKGVLLNFLHIKKTVLINNTVIFCYITLEMTVLD